MTTIELGEAKREPVVYLPPESDGFHTYVWPYEYGKISENIGYAIKALKADINVRSEPPVVRAIHIDYLENDEGEVRAATREEIKILARLAIVDHGIFHIGIAALLRSVGRNS